MRYGFIREQQKAYPVTVLCAVMRVSTSAYFFVIEVNPLANGGSKALVDGKK